MRTFLPQIIDYPALLDAAWQQHLAPKLVDAPTVISTFAGCGGSSLGYSMAGCKELLAIELDNNAIETFKLNFPEVPVYHGDITKLSVNECMQIAGLTGPGQLDILDGSPPCQGFSTTGKRIFTDSRNQLFREYVRLLQGLKPKVFVMENVSGMIKGKMKLIFAEILNELKASNYIVSAKLLNAKWFGVPQSRERLIFVGIRKDLGIVPNHPKVLYSIINVKQAFKNCLSLTFANEGKGDKEVFSYIKQGQEAKNCVPKEILKKYIPKMAKNKKYVFNNICKRLDENLPSMTIVKTFIPYSSIPISPYEDRYISGEECKRLCSFPDKFLFIGGYKNWIARMGNSVPPLLMKAIAEEIKQCLL